MDGNYTHAEHTYIYQTLENIKEPIITEKYSLPGFIREKLLQAPSPFGSAYAEFVYLRTYSRKKPDGTKEGQDPSRAAGTKERWAETVIRVVEGTIEAYLTHYKKNGLHVDRDWLDQHASKMALSLFKRQWTPPGRGLYAMGTDHTRQNGNAALNNCYACETKNLPLAASWTMDQLMCGGGVGFDCSWDGWAIKPNKEDTFTFQIPDTRQGWVAALELLLRAYIPIEGKITNGFPKFDYSLIRPYGEPIHGFGGTASGPGPLKTLLDRVEIFLDTYLEYKEFDDIDGFYSVKERRSLVMRIFKNHVRRLHQVKAIEFSSLEADLAAVEKACENHEKTYSSTRLIVDIFNAIGVTVVAGNVRRSAMIAIGDAGDEEFIDLKNMEINPERQSIMWMSNNTVRFEKSEDFEQYIPEIATRIQKNGEPGFFNVINARKYGRYTDTDYGEDTGRLLNPCVTGDTNVMTDEGWKKVIDLVGKPFNAVVDGCAYPSTEQGFWCTGVKEVFEITVESGAKVRATSNHKFLKLFHEDTEHPLPVWTSISEGLKKRDYIRIAAYSNGLDKVAYSKIVDIAYSGKEAVYDCTINEIHCFNAGGIIAHNCGEIILNSFEPCTLATVAPTHCLGANGEIDMDVVLEAARYATFYATTVTCIKHHWGVSNAVIAHNRRIGVSLTGIAEIYDKIGYTRLTTLCRSLYKEIRAYNTALAAKAGIPRAIRVTTVKPEGSLSIILETAGAGIHFPICRFAKRRIGLAKNDPLVEPLREAGYELEDSTYSNSMIYAIFPISSKSCRSEREVSIYEQFGLVSSLQRSYADNSVSFTGHFSIERESKDVERVIAMFAPQIKACSMLPYSDDTSKEQVYKHMPFEEITEEEYKELMSKIKPVVWSGKGEDAAQPRGCTNDSCTLEQQ